MNDFNFYVIALVLLGITVLLMAILKFVKWLWKYVWLPGQPQGARLAERYGLGSWVLITGASDGLGKSFAQQLSQYGFNLILVSRTQEKLNRLQTELAEYKVKIRTVSADLSDTSELTYTRISEAVKDVNLSIVINCVGITVHRRYADIPPATLCKLLSVNVNTTSIITQIMLPLLMENTQASGHRCALLNVGSIVGRFYWPGTQLYGACKAFIDHLTVPLAYEYGDKLDVLSFQPTVMATSMASGTEPAAITISPQVAAHAALSHLGRVNQSHGHWRHALLAALLAALPAKIRNRKFLKEALKMGKVELAKEY